MTHPEKCINCGHCIPVCSSGAHSTAPDGSHRFDRTKCTSCGKCAGICFPGAVEMAARRLSVEQVMAEIRQDKAYYQDSNGGVTLSGGEVFCQKDFAAALISACRRENIHIAVETNLYWDFSAMLPVLKELDLLMFDLKLADSGVHRQWTGADNEVILKNIALLDTLNIPLIARTPLIPGVTDNVENISAIAALLKLLKNLQGYELLNFNPLGESKYTSLALKNPFAGSKPLPPEKLRLLCDAAAGLNVKIG